MNYHQYGVQLKMKNFYLLIFIVLLPVEVAFAAERGWVGSLISSLLPIILFIGVWLYLMKKYSKQGEEVNKGIIESNDRLTEQLKRIADHLEKNG